MTAEIVLLNKHGVALAADSAVTIGHMPKVFVSANKIFALSKYEPVGAMIYGGAELLGMPWETVVKEYRRHLGKRSFPKLEQYAVDFLDYINSNLALFPTEERMSFAEAALQSYFEQLKGEILVALDEEFEGDVERSREEVVALARDHIVSDCAVWREADELAHDVDSTWYEPLIVAAIQEHFEELAEDPVIADTLTDLGTLLFTRVPPYTHERSSGLVVSGFGSDEVFPSMWHIAVLGVTPDHVLHTRPQTETVSLDSDAFVVPFAQREMVETFMEGVDPRYQQTVEGAIDQLVLTFPDIVAEVLGTPKPSGALRKQLEEIKEAILADYREGLQSFRATNFVVPVLSMVGSLPKEDLAEMAESLVNLTSFKRKVTPELETVGGPIDVAVISKGDGFVWIRRKHYFAADLNPQFFANYYKEEHGG